MTRFSWKSDDQNEPRFWEIFTGQLDFVSSYKYRVRVVVRGTIFSQGMEWTGQWTDVGGNGPLMISVPMSDGPGVTRRSLITTATAQPVATTTPAAASGATGRPPRATTTTTAGAPAKRKVSELIAASDREGMTMRDLDRPFAETLASSRNPKSAGGYSLEPDRTAAKRAAAPPPTGSSGTSTGYGTSTKGSRSRGRSEVAAASSRSRGHSEPGALELADGWSTEGSGNE